MDFEQFTKALADTETKISTRLAAVEDAQRRAAQAGAETKAEKPTSVGQAFVKSDAFAAWREGRTTKASFVKAAASPILAGTLPEKHRVNEIGTAIGFGMIGVKDSLGRPIPVKSNMVEFPRLVAWTNSAAEVLEGAKKPESKAEFELIQAPVSVIAHVTKISKQLQDDAAAIAGFVDDLMEVGLKDKVDAALLSSATLKGIFTTGNYTAHGLSQGSGETNLDLVRKSSMAIAAAGFKANAVYLNPIDYDAITSVKTTDGAYLMRNPASDGVPPLWGMAVVLTSNMPQGSFLVGDTRQAKVFDRQEVTVEIFEQDEDNVQHNLLTIRAETRLGVGVLSPIAFVGGALW